MSFFDSGISDYLRAQATVSVAFPIDKRGVAHICCAQCWLYRRSSNLCGLTSTPVAFPESYVSGDCPLLPLGETEDNKNNDMKDKELKND